MNILLIGGEGSLINSMIVKLKKEGHRIYLLTGVQNKKVTYEKVFEKYNFTYDSENLNDIFESVNPDVTIFMGAYDTNFQWKQQEREAVRYSSSLMNILVAYSMTKRGKFIYLSSEEVYSGSYPAEIREDEPVSAVGFRGMTLAQGEKICENYQENWKLDIIVLRLDHLYHIPRTSADVDNICARMCISAMEKGYIIADNQNICSLLYESDAVEFIYRVVKCNTHQHVLYHLTSDRRFREVTLARLVAEYMGGNVSVVENEEQGGRRILSGRRFEEEFGITAFRETEVVLKKMVQYMKKNEAVFLDKEEPRLPLWKRVLQKWGWFFRAIVHFLENLLFFVPFFMLNNRVVGSQYFSQLDFYLLYVLLFAIVYGQQQATFSALLATAGYLFRQTYTRSGFEVMLDYNTYVWIAQLFILGLVVGYMHDQIRRIRKESEELEAHLSRQLSDIRDINGSNVRVKDVLERQVIDQKDSIGKIYNITSRLDQYMPDEVLFYAVEMLTELLGSRDVAIYSIANKDYARMFSAGSVKAREMGNSIRYREMGEVYQEISAQRVYINRRMDEHYPLMANAIFEEDQMKMIIMIWGISWERMTLGQANLLKVISYLIQNAVLRANRYMMALEEKRYLEDTRILEPEAFTSLAGAYQKARKRNLTECSFLKIETDPSHYLEAGKVLKGNLRQSDYMGNLKDGGLYVLLANTNREEAGIVVERFAEKGYKSQIVERVEL